MEPIFFLKGVLIGFSIAAPVGPIGLLCIQRSLILGRKFGLLSGLGAASADAVYGFVAGFGLTFVSGFLVRQMPFLRIAGGAFLLFLGFRTFFSKPKEAAHANSDSLLGAYASTFFLTLTNPATILSFAAIFAGLGVGGAARDYASASLLVAGVFSGSSLWWLMLASGVGLFRKRFDYKGLLWVNRVAGLVIAGFGIFAFLG